jgi:fumarate reductase flavoprotein subunit
MSASCEEPRILTADIVVVGAGGAGLSAAVSAAYKGARVIIIEKASLPGGITQFAEGVFGVESSIQRKTYRGPTRDDAFKIKMECTHWRANPGLVRAFIDRSGETIDWLIGQGVEFRDK